MNNQPYYAIYSRKSKYTGKGESIDNQIELCKKHLIFRYGKDIINKILIYQDEGYTGYNTNRPKFKELLKDIKNKKIKLVIVYKLDRISRNVTDFCILKNELTKFNVDFISVTENFDTSTPIGNAMLMITSVFAQLERDTIAERIKDNMIELAKTGRWLGGTTPIGYRSKKIVYKDNNGKKKYLYKLEKINDEVKIVKLIFNKMKELKGLSKLESYLIQQNIKTRNNNNFTRFSLLTILKNPVYVIADKRIKNFFEKMGSTIYINNNELNKKNGLISYNKRIESKNKKSLKDVSKWIIATGKHEGIISSNTFIKTWNLINNNKDKRCRPPRQNKSILSGIIKCKYCNSYMRPRLRNTYASNNERNFSYLCELKDKSRKKLCKCKNINGIDTDKLLLSKIQEFKVPTIYIINKLKKLKTNKISKNTILNNEQTKELAINIINNHMNIFNNLDTISKRKLIKILIKSVETDGKNIYLNLV